MFYSDKPMKTISHFPSHLVSFHTKHLWFRFLAILCLLSLTACDRPQILHESQWIMGTVVEITWVGSSSSEKVIKQAFDAIKSVDGAMNPDRPGSELSRINAHAGEDPLVISPLTCRVIYEGLLIGKETNGTFDITMGPLIKLWGWDTKNPHLPPELAIANALKNTGIDKVRCDPITHRISLKIKGMSLDLGGIAKGFAVDRASALLNAKGIHNFIVNAGGDLYTSGAPLQRLWHIGIQDPDDPKAVIAIVSLSDRAIATSGDYERYFIKGHVRYHHILNPRTGLPARGLRSVSVLAKNTMDADALATALFVMGRERAIQWAVSHPEYQVVLMDAEHRIFASKPLEPIVQWKKRFKKHVTYF